MRSLRRSLLACACAFWAGAAAAGPRDADFFNISDAHMTEPTAENGWRLSRDSVDVAKSVIATVNKSRPDFVLFSGDVIEGKRYGMKSLKLATETLSGVLPRWFVVPGNHDGHYVKKEATLDEFDKARFIEAFRGHGPEQGKGDWRYDVPGKEITLVGLNTSRDGESSGRLERDQLEWLDKVLSEVAADRIVIVVMHHPAVVFDADIVEPSKKMLKIFVLENGDDVRAVLERHRVVKLVVSGHTHFAGHMEKNGIQYVSTPSINSWPCRYARFRLRAGTLSVSYESIPQAGLIEESRRGLLSGDSVWMEVFKSSDAVLRYFGKNTERFAVRL
ncbi:MAG: metallophosphoesterase [Elusimicrobia bacterium]|nr:metallophosphoesterase [Elusimicrobiota bacterium]